MFENYLPPTLKINGDNPWDPQIRDPRFYRAVALSGTLGLGRAYMNGWWNCNDPEQLDVFFEHMLRAGLLERSQKHPRTMLLRAKMAFTNPQSHCGAKEVIEEHYDPDSDIILSVLDPYNQYTCGYGDPGDDLETAQLKKLDLICRKLKLQKGDLVADIGGGWCGFAKYAAEHYGCHVTVITIAREQIAYGKKLCEGLPVDIRYCDYRDFTGSFDKILICGMGEHVGHKNYRTLTEVVHRCLLPDGIFLWHSIGKEGDNIPSIETWMMKYIFPNIMLPTPQRVARATEGLFDMVDMQEFGEKYAPTLRAWRNNLVWNLSAKMAIDRDEREFAKYFYYFSFCEALFRVRKINLFQFVFRKAGASGYQSVR